MKWAQCVIDASLSYDGSFCFCPVEGDFRGDDFAIVTGMNYITAEPPGGMKLVGVVHPDGQEAVEAWMAENGDRVQALHERMKARR